MTEEQSGTGRRFPGALLGWGLTLLAVLYAYAIQQGIGPPPVAVELRWFEPSGYLFRWGWLSWAFETSLRLMLVFSLPAIALTFGVFLTTRSSVARAMALSSVVATVLFCFYGDVATRVWEFFHWRGSAVITLTGVSIGFALAAPLLAASWLRLRWPYRLLVYLPTFFLVVAFIRNATGTDLHLPFAISPWPAVSVFGIEIGVLFVMTWLLGAALGVGGVALARARSARALGAVGILLGVTVPVGLLALGSALGLLPFKAGPGTLVPVGVACLVAIALSSTVGVRGHEDALRVRAIHLGVGAALVAAPLLIGQVWARFDYYLTREHRAGALIDAMERYYEKEAIYPDELDELVTGGFLDGLPVPSIGFSFLYDGTFRYRSFGTSYILEFPAPRWVECAYSPPYEEESEEEDEELEAWESADYVGNDNGENLSGAWSCPEKPPELW